ncbi:MAG: hypothetical protein E7363_03670 [Clostridiales bacterium]|nr:hypothetical protein [Clostridiales bacterium]
MEEELLNEIAAGKAAGVEDSHLNEVSTANTKCPGCGANMRFDPKTQGLLCPYCGKKQALPSEFLTAEIDLKHALVTGEKWAEADKLFACETCGAKVVVTAGSAARNCPFCGAANILETKELPGVKPNGVVPFALAEGEALTIAKKWAKKKLFAPGKFKKSVTPQALGGVYSPCFTFDSMTESLYDGRFGEAITVGTGKNRRTEIRWYHVSGSYDYNFDEITVNADTRVEEKTLRKLAPYHTNGALAYRSEFLSGFMANHYNRPVEEMWGEAKTLMDSTIRNGIIHRYGADRVAYLNVSTVHPCPTYKYVLIPVYVGHFTFRKKRYNWYVNGVSGKITGKAPVSFWRVLSAIALGVGAIALAALLL